MAKMAASDVLELLDWIQAHNIEVWLNGSWGIDALLGHQTRERDRSRRSGRCRKCGERGALRHELA